MHAIGRARNRASLPTRQDFASATVASIGEDLGSQLFRIVADGGVFGAKRASVSHTDARSSGVGSETEDVMDRELRRTKLSKLIESEGFENLEQMLQSTVFDSVSPGICVNPECNHTVEVEPDQDRGWCEVCETQSVHSALILACLI